MFERYFWYHMLWDDDDDDYGLGSLVLGIFIVAVLAAIALFLGIAYGVYGIYGLVVWIADKNAKEEKIPSIDWVFSLRALHKEGTSLKNVLIFDGAMIAELPATGIRYLYRFMKSKAAEGGIEPAAIEETH